MTTPRLPVALLAATLLASACAGGGSDGSGDAGGGDDGGAGGGGAPAPIATSIALNPATLALEEGATEALTVTATFDDASTSEVTATATFSVDGAAVTVDAAGLVTAAAPGEATITARLGELTATATATVSAAPITGLSLEFEGAWKVGTTVQLHVFGVRSNGRRDALTEDLAFQVSDPRVATIDAAGLVTVHAGGPLTIDAFAEGQSARLEVRPTCDYPRFSTLLQYDRIMPPLSWPAKWPDGTNFDFALSEVYCDADWRDTRTVIFVVSAGWCTPCTLYAQRLEQEVDALTALGAQVVIVEAQDTEGLSADLAFAYAHLDRITGTIPGIAVGDADTRGPDGEPRPDFMQTSAIVRAFPSVFVVRTRDMRIIADQNRSDFYLPLQDIAADPEADWSNPGLPTFTNACGPGDEEGSEPNDTPADVAPLEPGTLNGGICTDAPDLFEINLTGAWRLELAFSHAVGDLDVFVWDTARNQPAQINGNIVGSASAGDLESFEHTGPAVVGVAGYQHASAPYTLSLTAL